jgi:hypothetical protein
MHRPILLALPLACLALLSSIAFLAVVFIAAGLHMVWTIKELEDPPSQNPTGVYAAAVNSRTSSRKAALPAGDPQFSASRDDA